MEKRITIDPLTRLEGHGKIDIFLDDAGNVRNAYLQIPELRGFEEFCVGRPAEEMPQITERICGVCPTAHHMASTKCLDDLFAVAPPPAARKIREYFYNLFLLEDHTLHIVILGGPDFIVGPQAPKEERNILGVLKKVGLDVGKTVIKLRRSVREIMTAIGGKAVHPVLGLPGGVAKGITKEQQKEWIETGKFGVEFAETLLKLFDDVVLKNKEYMDIILSDIYRHETYYMGLVDGNNRVNFYDGTLRVVDPRGMEYARFTGKDYLANIAEHVEPWTYMKMPFLKDIGWKGFVDGSDSGVYRVAPLARLNASEGMTTKRAQEEYDRMFATIGAKPVHNTLANHWARVIETIHAAERALEIISDPDITDPKIREIPSAAPVEGVGVVEAPRGVLIHNYKTDDRGILTGVNIIVATQHNAAAMVMGIEHAAKKLIKDGKVSEGLLNMVEMAYRAYDPCHGCATHSLPGQMPLIVLIHDASGLVVREMRR